MKTVYLRWYLVQNLGYDLFIKILVDRYPNCKFVAYSSYKYKHFNNLKVYNMPFINKLIRIISNEKFNLGNILKRKCSYMVSIGGSIFYDNDDVFNINKKIKNEYYRPFLHFSVIGSNINGTREPMYYKLIEDLILNKADDVCFRDKLSYNLCKSNHVRYAPDIVFSLTAPSVSKSNKVLFSVIDCSKKMSNNIQVDYENKLIEMIEKFNHLGYEITLMSFCEYEGDKKSIVSILKKLDEKESNIKVDTYFYKGNLEEALNIINNHDIIVGGRFHANILGLAFNKTIIPMIYSDKMENVLTDIKFEGLSIDLNSIKSFNVDNLNKGNLNYHLNTDNLKDESKQHFEFLDNILK